MSESNARSIGFNVNGISINVNSMPQAVACVAQSVARGQGFCLFTLNLDHCAKLRRAPEFRAAYRRARFVSADGFPIVLLGRLHGVPVERTAGADMVWPICAEAARQHLPVFLFGPSASVVARTQQRLADRLPELAIVGSYVPGANFDPHSIDGDFAIERIRQSGARICFLAVGAPRQEIFAARCLDCLPDVGFICVGAAFDFLAGSQKRAPRFFQEHGLEWLWRLSSDPRRLTARYLECAAVFPSLVVETIPQAISGRRRHAQ